MPRDVDVSVAKLNEWAEDNLIDAMCEYMWHDALENVSDGDDAFVSAEKNEVDASVEKDCRQIVRAVQDHYGMAIRDVAELVGSGDEYEIDPDELAYYLVMQARGHGVSWSDDHDEKLWTPDWSAAMWYADDAAGLAWDNWVEDDEDAED